MNARHVLPALLVLAAASACGGEAESDDPPVVVPGGDARQGRLALRAYGCTSCHAVPGVRGARARVGPPLTGWAGRRYVAGQAPNEPEALMRFIRDPQSVAPGSAMPDVGVTEADARHIAAYLYTLRR